MFVDTAPVPEKPLGQAAGLGWQGKHTNLVSRELGIWFFIGSIFTTLDSARGCARGGPLRLVPGLPRHLSDGGVPGALSAGCAALHFLPDHRAQGAGAMTELRARMGNRIYGCDDCLAVCPWNKFAVAASDLRYAARDDLVAPPLAELARLDDAGFRARFSGSPIKRIGRDRFVRNVLYAIGNSGDPGLLAVAQGLAGDTDPAVADAARWAALRLAG